MKQVKNRKVLVAMAIVLALVIATTATFAWLTSKATVANEFKNEGFGKGDGLVVIEQETEFEFEIGKKTPKHVSIMNASESPMLARVSFEEMIKLLGTPAGEGKKPGDVTVTASATGAAGTTPVPFNYVGTEASGTWTNITETVTFTPALPGTVSVWSNGQGQYKAAHLYQAAAGEEPAKYQVVNITGKLNGTAMTDVVLGYAYYTEGTASYNAWNKLHNYEPWKTETFINSGTGVTPATKAASSLDPTEILLNYVDTNFDADPEAGKWFYNANDGYFYYIGVLAGGETSPMMLEGVTLVAGADAGAWQKYEYTLVVVAEGLQATVEALTDTDAKGDAAGWQLDPVADKPLVDALKEAIDPTTP